MNEDVRETLESFIDELRSDNRPSSAYLLVSKVRGSLEYKLISEVDAQIQFMQDVKRLGDKHGWTDNWEGDLEDGQLAILYTKAMPINSMLNTMKKIVDKTDISWDVYLDGAIKQLEQEKAAS